MNFIQAAGNAVIKLLSGDNALLVTPVNSTGTEIVHSMLVDSSNVELKSLGGGGGAGGGSIVYTNMSNDFIATPTNGAKTITITGLPFTFDATHVAAGSIKKIAVTTGIVTPLAPTTISVSGGVITLTGIDNFATGDQVAVTLIGPDKAYDKQDYTKVVVLNSLDTDVETLVNETNILGYKASADGGGSGTLLIDADGAFSAANVAVGYLGWQTADNQSALLSSIDSATNITSAALSGAATWASKAYSLPQVKRYEIDASGWNNIAIHYRLRCLTFSNAYLKVYGTMDAAATVDSDTGWADISTAVLGAAAGITVTTSLTTIFEGIAQLTAVKPMLKYMVKLVVESNSASPNTNSFIVYTKKSR